MGLAASTSDTSGSGQDATASATITGSISGDTIGFGDGSADSVTIAPSVTITAMADTTHAATANATVTTGNISNDKITFGNGDGDLVAIGPTLENVTATGGGNATTNQTVTSAGSITGDTIAFGDGVGDPVSVENGFNLTVIADARSGSSPDRMAINNLTAVVHSGNISSDKITFGDGGGDFVKLGQPTIDFTATAEAGSGGHADQNISISVTADGKVNDNTVTFGNGDGDYVSAFGDLIHNTITFGNGSGDYVTNVFASFAGLSSNNKITMGNGNNDSVTLGVGVTSAGGDSIVTGTGLGDTVQVGTHNNADTFGFALGTNGTAFTEITGARAGDQVISGNNLGANVVTEPGTFASLLDFFNFVSGLPPTNNNTYIGNNGADTFIVTDHKGELGVVEIVGVFTGNTNGTHVLTLA